MNKKFHRLYLHEIAFDLIPQQLFCTKTKKYQGVKEKKHDFEMSKLILKITSENN